MGSDLKIATRSKLSGDDLPDHACLDDGRYYDRDDRRGKQRQ
jgi:hypothetical protein